MSPAPRPRRRAKQVGIAGAAVGVVAAGLATAFAVERTLVRRSVNAPGDPHVDEPFGDQPFDAELTVTAADGTDLHVEIVEPTAPTDKPTIVFVHGFALDMGTFYFQRKVLAERGDHRLVFYDQPGHGRSSKLKSGNYDIAALGESLAAVLDATVPDGHIILVGHSMGGMTIMAFAEQYPEWFGNRVTGVVLMSTSAGLIDKAKLGIPTLVARASAPFFPLWGTAAHLGGERDRPGPDRLLRPGLAAHPAVRLRRRQAEPVVGHLRGEHELQDLGRDADQVPAHALQPQPLPGAVRAARRAGAGDRRRPRTT